MARNAPIGILGGIFDPVHCGHLATAKLAQEYFNLEKILFIPAGTPPHKRAPRAAAKHRLAMLELGIGKIPGFEIWKGELSRNGWSYTVDTLKELKKRHPRAPFYFIIGSDNIKEIPRWHNFRELLTLATFCVAHRPGHSMHIPPELAEMNLKPFPGPEWKLSSTMVRRYLAKGYSCDFLLPPKVLAYIKEHRLYSK
jgi:nicotinate-nucleotide adenylyltransferase